MSTSEKNQSRNKTWMPVYAAAIGGLLSLTGTVISAWQANRSSESAEKAEEAKEILVSSKPLPVGTIIASFLTPKEFYKLMDGRETYDKDESTWCHANGKENVLGTPYFESRGAGKPKIENLQGYFLRGYDETRLIDTVDRELGSTQIDATKLPNDSFTGTTANDGQHIHLFLNNVFIENKAAIVAKGENWGYANGTSTISKDSSAHEHKLVIDNGGDKETRPVNVSVNYFIKIR